MSDATLYSVDRGVATITLNCPDEKNSLSAALTNSLGDNLTAAQDDDAVRAVVLTNVGNTFCAGANLKNPNGETPRYNLVDIFTLMMNHSKPIVGRINGHCMGGGVGLAAACDISVIADECKVGFTEVRIGVAPAIISVVCLPKMRRADAMELMLGGEKITATRAAEVGLLNYALPAEQIDSKVSELAAKLVQGGPKAMAATKQLVYKVPSMDLDSAYGWTAELSGQLFRSEEAAAGIGAFRNREKAPWVPE